MSGIIQPRTAENSETIGHGHDHDDRRQQWGQELIQGALEELRRELCTWGVTGHSPRHQRFRQKLRQRVTDIIFGHYGDDEDDD